MAKVKLPLVSLEARGAIGKAIVYFPWKGINAVREHVIPANPKTPDQTTQRGYLTQAVSDWHATDFILSDLAAWRVYASIMTTPMTAFNTFVRKHIQAAILGKTWTKVDHGEVFSIGADSAITTVHSDDTSTLMTVDLFINPRVKIATFYGSYIPGSDRWTTNIGGLVTKTVYYLRYGQITAALHGELAFVKFTTT